MAQVFPGGLFGYKKSAVNSYLTNLEKKHEEAVEILQNELDEVKRKNMEMLAELGQIPTLEYSLQEQAEDARRRDEKNAGIINELKQQLAETEARYFESKEELAGQVKLVSEKIASLDSERERVTNILVLAEEKAEALIEQARVQIINERKLQAEIVSHQKQQFLRYFENLKSFRLGIVNLFENFNGSLAEEEHSQLSLFNATDFEGQAKEANSAPVDSAYESSEDARNRDE